jgi:hypothetical protein
MNDIVSSENLPLAHGIKSAAAAQMLKNFRQVKNPGEARALCRIRGTLIYSAGYELDDGVIKDLAAAGGAVVFSFTDLLKERGFRRAIVLSKMRLAFSSCRKSGCGTVVCTLAANAASCRSARELGAFASVLGMTAQEKIHAEATARRLVGK